MWTYLESHTRQSPSITFSYIVFILFFQWVKNVSESIKSREEMFGLRDTLLQEQWKKDDDKARLVREQREAELKQMEEESRLSSMQEDMQMRMQRLQLERDAKVRVVMTAV